MINNKIKYKVLGVMSGTSLDGVDLALCSFEIKKNWTFKIQKSKTVKYCDYWEKKLKYLHIKKNSIDSTNKEYGQYLGGICNEFLGNEKVDFISSHGHTIFHQPKNNFTLQIGCGKAIAKTTNKKTINNFRNLDISLNGQGAPLVPIGDLYLFPNYKFCINLGGFANISIKNNKGITAFDICPVNIILNKISQKLGQKFDTDGEIARKGNLIPHLLIQLNNLNFYKKKSPKSLSREWVENFIFPLIKPEYKSEDVLHTFCEHISIKIGSLLTDQSALFTGGGVFNTYLIERIKKYSISEIIIPCDKIIKFKESLIFAFLAILKDRNEINCLKSVTGANKDSCGGEIYYP